MLTDLVTFAALMVGIFIGLALIVVLALHAERHLTPTPAQQVEPTAAKDATITVAQGRVG